eukprot:g16792.t1
MLTCPSVLGQWATKPFLREFKVNVCHDGDDEKPYATIKQKPVPLYEGADIAMLEIEFVPAAEVDQARVATPRPRRVPRKIKAISALTVDRGATGKMKTMQEAAQPLSIGYKAAYRISKLERLNNIHRNNVRKLTVEPYDANIAALLWSRMQNEVIAESLEEALDRFLEAENSSDENELEMLVRRDLLNEHLFQINSTPILGTSLTPLNLASGGYYAGSRDWEALREDLAEGEGGEALDQWFVAKARLQAAVRKAIRTKDVESLLKRRELVGRNYKRCIDTSRLTPGMNVAVRRQDGKFRHYLDGEVVTVYEDGADVRVGGGVTKYFARDIALHSEDAWGTALEMYVDGEIGDELETRLSQAFEPHDGEQSEQGDDDDSGGEPPRASPSNLTDNGAATIFEDRWSETPEELTRWHVAPRTHKYVPTAADLPGFDPKLLTGERKMVVVFLDTPTEEVEYHDSWKTGKRSKRSGKLNGLRAFVGRTIYKKKPSMFLRAMTTTRVSPNTRDAELSADQARETEFPDANVYEWAQHYQQQFSDIDKEASQLIENEIEQAAERGGPRSSRYGPVRPTRAPLRSTPAAAYITVSKEQSSKDATWIAPEEKAVSGGYLHEALRQKLRNCVSTMELKIEEGQLYLTPSSSIPIGNVVRGYDFSVLPEVVSRLGDKQQHDGKLLQSDGFCYLFSQLLNGKPVKEMMNSSDNRDLDYVVTAVEMQKGGALAPSKYIGNSVIVRWGEELSPEIVTEEEIRDRPVSGAVWVAKLYYEVTHDAHEKMQLFTAGAKSSAVEVDEKTAERLGFQSYYVPSVRSEVKAVVGHGIFGRTARRKDVTARNIITSRLVVVIKIDLGTGKVSRIKSRWVSRGFEDRRFHKGEAGLKCRSYTMADASYLFLLQFAQARKSNLWLGDIKEAFLKGMKFLESYGEAYMEDPNSEVWMTVPKVIQQMYEEFGLLEVVELLASIYGCKDAPLNWQRTLHNVMTILQFKQSLVDPCLWLVYATAAEKRAIAEDRVDEYYWDKVKQLDLLEAADVAGAASIICGGEQPVNKLPASVQVDSQFLNPETEGMAEALTMHVQEEGLLLGGIGSHVDDTVSAGHKLFMLRIYALFRKFPLGSFTKLDAGTRDNFIGRENHCMPAVVEQHQLNKAIDEHEEFLTDKDIRIQSFNVPVDEEKLQAAEHRYNISRDQHSSTYPAAPKIACTAQNLFDGADMGDELVFVVSQESYAQKLRTIDRNEVEKFIVERNRAKSKWQKKQLSNPFRGRIGEIIWLTKTNGIIAEGVSQLAGQLINAEQTPDWESVQYYVNDLNNLILLAQESGASCRKIRRLGGLGEHGIFGCGDAAKDRVGGTVNLAGPADRRFSTMGQFSKAPKRVYNSSTGIETLAARMVNSELLFTAQLAMDLQLISLKKSFLQLVDNKNITQEPKEKNLRLDFFALQQLRESGQLELVHIPGALNWTDPLTKALRDVLPELLYFASVWGVCDDRIEAIIAAFVKNQNSWKKESDKESEEVELRDLGVVEPGKEKEVGVGFHSVASDGGFWKEDSSTITRIHPRTRCAFFTPKTKEMPYKNCKKYLADRRTTYVNQTAGVEEVFEDSWRGPASHRPVYDDNHKWTGKTVFYKNEKSCGINVLSGAEEGKAFPTKGGVKSNVSSIPQRGVRVRLLWLNEFRTTVKALGSALILAVLEGCRRLTLSQKFLAGVKLINKKLRYTPRCVMTTNYLRLNAAWTLADVHALKSRMGVIIVFTQPVEQIKHLSPPTLELKNKCAACSRKWISYCIKAHQKRPEAHKEGIKHLQPGCIEAHNKHIIWKGFDRTGRAPDSSAPGQFSQASSQMHGGLHNLNVHEHTTEAEAQAEMTPKTAKIMALEKKNDELMAQEKKNDELMKMGAAVIRNTRVELEPAPAASPTVPADAGNDNMSIASEDGSNEGENGQLQNENDSSDDESGESTPVLQLPDSQPENDCKINGFPKPGVPIPRFVKKEDIPKAFMARSLMEWVDYHFLDGDVAVIADAFQKMMVHKVASVELRNGNVTTKMTEIAEKALLKVREKNNRKDVSQYCTVQVLLDAAEWYGDQELKEAE